MSRRSGSGTGSSMVQVKLGFGNRAGSGNQLLLLYDHPMYVTDVLVSTGPPACLSPFSVIPWIRSDKSPNLKSEILLFILSRNSHELNNVFILIVVVVKTNRCSLLLKH